jgi:hypothetical protein
MKIELLPQAVCPVANGSWDAPIVEATPAKCRVLCSPQTSSQVRGADARPVGQTALRSRFAYPPGASLTFSTASAGSAPTQRYDWPASSARVRRFGSTSRCVTIWLWPNETTTPPSPRRSGRPPGPMTDRFETDGQVVANACRDATVDLLIKPHRLLSEFSAAQTRP